MQLYKQLAALMGALVLAGGLISCNSDRNTANRTDLTGMLVHEPVFVHRNGSTVALSQVKKSEALHLDDQMKLTPVIGDGQGLSTLIVESNCQAGNQSIGTDVVTLPYSQDYSVVQFFTVKTLLNEVLPGATDLTCSMHFTVTAANGSTHSFDLQNIQVKTEDPSDVTVQILDEGLAASNDGGFIRMDYNELGRYRLFIAGIDYQSADFVCEINRAPIDKGLINNPLYGLRFEPRVDRPASPASMADIPQQYCRVLVYRSDSTVVAASNLILMTMAKPQFSVRRVPSTFPDPAQSHNIFDYSWRDYSIENHDSTTLYFAVPSGGTSTVDYENVYAQHPVSNPYLWTRLTLPTQIAVQAQTNSANGYQVFLVNPGQSVDVRVGVMPHDFVCDQWRVPMEYTVAINDSEIPIYQIIDPQISVDPHSILHSDILEKRFVMTVTEDTFGSNEDYGNNCGRVWQHYPTGKVQLVWSYCALPFPQEPAVQPMTADTRNDGICSKVD